MEKQYLSSIIKKYYLDGSTPTARWVIKDSVASITFKTSDRSVLGILSANLELPDAELGVFDSKNLLSLLGALDSDVSLSYKHEKNKLTGLSISDDAATATYMLADLSVVEEVSGLKKVPDWSCRITLKKDFVDRFIRAKKGISSANIVAINSGINPNEVEFIINYAQHNTSRITLTAAAECTEPIDLSAFDAEMISKILLANTDFLTEAEMLVSNQGLACLRFKNEDYEAEYYLQRIKL